MTFEEAVRNLTANAEAIRANQERNCQRLFGMDMAEVEAILADRKLPEAEKFGASLTRSAIAMAQCGADWVAELQDEIRSLYRS